MGIFQKYIKKRSNWVYKQIEKYTMSMPLLVWTTNKIEIKILKNRNHSGEKKSYCITFFKSTVKTIMRVDFLLIRLGFCRNFQIFGAKEICKK